MFAAELPVGEEVLLPFTVPMMPTETGIVHFFRLILKRTNNTSQTYWEENKSQNMNINILALWKNMLMESFSLEPL